MEKDFRKHKVDPVFQSLSNNSFYIPSPTDRLNHFTSKDVCSIPCSWGAVFIGETSGSIKTSPYNDKCFLEAGLLIKSEVVEHQDHTSHKILLDSTSVLSFYFSRTMRKAPETSKHHFHVKVGGGYPLTAIFQTVVKPYSIIGSQPLTSSQLNDSLQIRKIPVYLPLEWDCVQMFWFFMKPYTDYTVKITPLAWSPSWVNVLLLPPPN